MRNFLALAALLLPIGAHANDTVMFTFSGHGDTDTRPFHIDAPWELQWTVGKGDLSVQIAAPDGTPQRMYVGLPPGGKAYQPMGGDFYLKVESTEQWTVAVVSVGK